MNLTSQYIVNPKSRLTYINSLATYKTIRVTSSKLRLGNDRQTLNFKDKKGMFSVGKNSQIKFKMILCPSGKFKMGDENRLTTIEKPFLISETEVTQEVFEAVMEYNPSHFQSGSDSNQRPVESVTWYDAVMFCNKLSVRLKKRPYYNMSNIVKEQKKGKNIPNIKSARVTINPKANGFRLPHEKEWEYAAKAGTHNQWAGTNDVNKIEQVAWFDKKAKNQTQPVKCKKPNEWGIYDMSGNVWEWCWNQAYESTHRVIRGGGWYGSVSRLRANYRTNQSPNSCDETLGFRIASSLVN